MTRRSRAARRTEEAGYVAMLVALLAGTVFLGMAALGVDVARWYVEMERIQKAADAAALAGVTYMPHDIASARSTAVAVASRNGYTAGTGTTVTVAQGSRASELRVTISRRVPNAFGAVLGAASSVMSRTALADYTAPAPMGSPCNTFGNEPRGSTSESAQPTGTALPSATFANCPKDTTTGTSQPRFWSAVEGPETDKLQGDRYQTRLCDEKGNAGKTASGCAGGFNTERRDDGYYYSVHVEQPVVTAGATVQVQVYDPIYTNKGVYCGSLPASSALVNDMNVFTKDGLKRYGRVVRSGVSGATSGAEEFCTGDTSPAAPGSSVSSTPMTTTFVMRGRTDTGNPQNSPVITTCDRYQFRGASAPTAATLRSSNSSYNPELARTFHQWFALCTFKPDRAGDYFLQVRTNVSLPSGTTYAYSSNNGKTNYIYKNNPSAVVTTPSLTTGAGANSFSLRAVPSSASLRDDVSVSAWERMPLLQIAAGKATFNLVRALPNTKGQYITFEFFDAADGANGMVTVLPPLDASGDVRAASGVPGCRAGLNDLPPASYATLTGCSYRVDGRETDGQLVHMVIPIPTNYSCDGSTLGGCWFRVEMDYGDGVTDLTTWSANIAGDPVRLVE